jgi:hypothetical protein
LSNAPFHLIQVYSNTDPIIQSLKEGKIKSDMKVSVVLVLRHFSILRSRSVNVGLAKRGTAALSALDRECRVHAEACMDVVCPHVAAPRFKRQGGATIG